MKKELRDDESSQSSTITGGTEVVYKKMYKKELWLFSDSFLKRSLSVMWHNIVATFVVYFVILILVSIFALLSFLVS